MFDVCLFDILVAEHESVPSIESLPLIATGLELRSRQPEMSAMKVVLKGLVYSPDGVVRTART
jgi:hypothetical protein